VAIRREARAAGVRGMRHPGWWFAMQMLSMFVYLSMAKTWWDLGLLSVTFLPAQATVNRLSDAHYGDRMREPMSSTEFKYLRATAEINR
jgi:hypothetical protein